MPIVRFREARVVKDKSLIRVEQREGGRQALDRVQQMLVRLARPLFRLDSLCDIHFDADRATVRGAPENGQAMAAVRVVAFDRHASFASEHVQPMRDVSLVVREFVQVLLHADAVSQEFLERNPRPQEFAMPVRLVLLKAVEQHQAFFGVEEPKSDRQAFNRVVQALVVLQRLALGPFLFGYVNDNGRCAAVGCLLEQCQGRSSVRSLALGWCTVRQSELAEERRDVFLVAIEIMGMVALCNALSDDVFVRIAGRQELADPLTLIGVIVVGMDESAVFVIQTEPDRQAVNRIEKSPTFALHPFLRLLLFRDIEHHGDRAAVRRLAEHRQYGCSIAAPQFDGFPRRISEILQPARDICFDGR